MTKFGAGRGSDTEGAGARTSRPTSSAANVWFCQCRNDELAADLVFRREQPASVEKCEDCGAERSTPTAALGRLLPTASGETEVASSMPATGPSQTKEKP